jgi:hypothetical protein
VTKFHMALGQNRGPNTPARRGLVASKSPAQSQEPLSPRLLQFAQVQTSPKWPKHIIELACGSQQSQVADICFGSKADIVWCPHDVCFAPKSGHCPLRVAGTWII